LPWIKAAITSLPAKKILVFSSLVKKRSRPGRRGRRARRKRRREA
jgi:hypothetical protein